MKIIHTSDWHIGQNFHDLDRTADHEQMLARLLDIAVAERPDAIVVSGDIFDTPTPPIRSQRLLHDSLWRIKEVLPDVVIAVTAGNHDGVTRLEITAGVWESRGVHFVGQSDTGRQIIDVGGKGWIVTVPHIYEGSYPRLDGEDPAEPRESIVAARMRAYHNRLLGEVAARNASGLPVVMMAHAAVTGSDTTGHDSARFMFYPLSCMGEGYDYLALGHIHRRQTLDGSDGRACYCGSPLRLSFDESADKSVNIVEIASRGAIPEVRQAAVTSGMPLVDFPEDSAPLDAEATVKALAALPEGREGYLRVRIDGTRPVAGNIRMEILRALQGKHLRYCTMQIVRPAVAATAGTLITRDELRVADPVDMAAAAYGARYGADMPEHLARLLRQAVGQAESREE